MGIDATLAAVHHLLAFGVVGMLMAEWALLRGDATPQDVGRLARYDMFYGIAAMSLIVVGVLRLTFGLKGVAFYIASPFFWLKIALFAAVGLISIGPTLRYLRWRREGGAPPIEQWAGARKRVVLQLHLLAGVMICAALMARGVGI